MSKPVIIKPFKSRDALFGKENGGVQISIFQTESPNFEARMTAAIVERWALVAAMPDGEDSAGRQKLRLPSPKELAARAAEIAAETYAQLAARGWMEEVMGPDEAEAHLSKNAEQGENP